MKAEQNQINPWVRANVYEHTNETRQLIPDHLKGEYSRLLAQVRQSDATLNEAHALVYEAQQTAQTAREKLAMFFGAITTAQAIPELVTAPTAEVVPFPVPAEVPAQEMELAQASSF